MKMALFLFLGWAVPLALFAQLDEFHTTGNMPIDFYGRAVDQHGVPLAGVKVKVEILRVEQTSPTQGDVKLDQVDLESGEDGRFSILNAKGHSVHVLSVTKKGYEASPGPIATYGYYPGQARRDPDKPIVFKMWKKQGAQPLTHFAWHHLMPCDGTPSIVPLTGTPGEGNVQICCTRNPLTSPPPGNGPFDYKFEISAMNGGIQATEDEFMYLAPESGYSPNVVIQEKAGDSGWQGRVKQGFYIKTSAGHYGRLTVDWYAAQNSPNYLELECYINPTGSRNLEYDKLGELRKHLSHPQFVHSPDE